MKFIITIDTEADNQWDHGRELTAENIKFLPRFQNLCDRYIIKPTYLVTSDICGDDYAKEILNEYQSSGRAEIGAHLHSWTTPPFLDKEGYRNNDKNHPFAHELPENLLDEKIKILTDQIETSFGKRPESFRSGRYGFDRNVARVLMENNYIVDSSVTPFIDWSAQKGIPGGHGGPDFMEYDPRPFRFDFDNGSLLEIPITILPTRFPLNKNESLARYYFRNVNNSMLLRIFRKMFFSHQPLWLRPNIWMNADLFADLIEESLNKKLPFIVMMFHSSELMPGSSIYWTSKDAVEKLYDMLESLFSVFHARGIQNSALVEASKSIKL
jgi:hypothetical protein